MLVEELVSLRLVRVLEDLGLAGQSLCHRPSGRLHELRRRAVDHEQQRVGLVGKIRAIGGIGAAEGQIGREHLDDVGVHAKMAGGIYACGRRDDERGRKHPWRESLRRADPGQQDASGMPSPPGLHAHRGLLPRTSGPIARGSADRPRRASPPECDALVIVLRW